MDILYLGSFPPQFLIEKSQRKIDSFYRTGELLVNGLRKRDDVKLRVITSPDIVSFPKLNLFYPSFTDVEGTTMVSSLNLPWIKQLWTIITMVTESIKHVKKVRGEITVIIPYMVFRHVIALRLIKLLYPKKVKTCVIIPDVFFPDSIIKRTLNHFAEKYTRKMDMFVLYTEAMSRYLKIESKPYIVIEGYSKVPQDPAELKEEEIEVVTYTGSLNKRYGILRLLDAIDLVESKSIEFHFYGAGDAEDDIQKKANEDKRIVFHGKVTKEDALKALFKSTILVNPRNANDGKYVEYSFPSKDIEYLSTGIPTILCKLPSMPKEYYNYFVDAEDGSPLSLSKAINKVVSMSSEDRRTLGINAHTFIKERMNIDNQVDRILNLLDSHKGL